MAKRPQSSERPPRPVPPPKAEVKLRHVARHAGVSESTVSNVMNGRSEKVGPETFQRVVESIQRGYRLLLGNTYRDPDKEREFLEELMRYGARGAITTSSLARQSQYVTLIERGLSMVSFDRRASPDFTLPIDYVSIDNFHAGHAATQHMIHRGHRAIRYVTAPAKTLSRIDRRTGYEQAMKEAGLEGFISVSEFEANATFMDSELPDVGRRIAKEIAAQKERPTGVVAMNDMLAIGVIAGLHESGLNVPDDVSVVGIDDLYLDSLITPALTSMRQPLAEIAETMVERIRLRLTNPRIPTSERVFKAELVERSSVKDRRGAG